MRTILVDKVLLKAVKDQVDDLFDTRRISPDKGLEDLIGTDGYKQKKRKEYVQTIIDKYPDIIAASPNGIIDLIKEFEEILPVEKISKKFWEPIVKALKYKELRNKEYLEKLNLLDVKTCFYCNAQLAVVIDKANIDAEGEYIDDDEKKATFELDHIYPKSKYPFLATSFFNLIPCCSICNKAKSNSNTFISDVFVEDQAMDVYKFYLDPSTESNYWISQKSDDIDFDFRHTGGDDSKLEEYNKYFQIQSIYSTQKDIIEELLQVKKFFDESHKAGILEDFQKLGLDDEHFERVLIGTYTEPEKIYLRPLSKFRQDIARDLNLIG
ncbi:MAG: hypothetical protein DCO96_15850 [Fluviicola sp. XM-24bin1]|nr:MAG: hypothetical protein DCO96_15850 [Fluviicola sp. XM-24bin1]